MFDDGTDRNSSFPWGSEGDDSPRGAEGAGPRADVVRELREGLADRIPVAVRGLASSAWAVPWRAAVVAFALAVLVGVALFARAQGTNEDVVQPAGRSAPARGAGPSSIAAAAAGPTAPPPGSAAATGQLVVHVVGRVRRPGLVRLAPGSRVLDAVTAAGGPTAGARLDRVNLARPLSDGEQLLVPGPDDPLPQPGVAGGTVGAGGAGERAGSGAVVDLNAATAADLDGLPGVGPVLAGRILSWRAQHGRFSRVAELGEVPGIGDKLLAQITPLVRV